MGQPFKHAPALWQGWASKTKVALLKYTIYQGIFLILKIFLSGVLQCVCFDFTSNVAVIPEGNTYVC